MTKRKAAKPPVLPIGALPEDFPNGAPPSAESGDDEEGYLVPHDHVALIIPLAESDPQAYCTKHIELNLRDPEVQRTVRSLFDALHNRHERLASGRHIDTPTQAVLWLLEQLAAADRGQKSELSASSA